MSIGRRAQFSTAQMTSDLCFDDCEVFEDSHAAGIFGKFTVQTNLSIELATRTDIDMIVGWQ